MEDRAEIIDRDEGIEDFYEKIFDRDLMLEDAYLNGDPYTPWYKDFEENNRRPVRHYDLYPEENEEEEVRQIQYQTDNRYENGLFNLKDEEERAQEEEEVNP